MKRIEITEDQQKAYETEVRKRLMAMRLKQWGNGGYVAYARTQTAKKQIAERA